VIEAIAEVLDQVAMANWSESFCADIEVKALHRIRNATVEAIGAVEERYVRQIGRINIHH
jgi:hypothetical protein